MLQAWLGRLGVLALTLNRQSPCLNQETSPDTFRIVSYNALADCYRRGLIVGVLECGDLGEVNPNKTPSSSIMLDYGFRFQEGSRIWAGWGIDAWGSWSFAQEPAKSRKSQAQKHELKPLQSPIANPINPYKPLDLIIPC